MPSKGKSDNYQVLGGIFDFLFKESSKPPDRRKPIKPTGISGSDLFTDAIVTSLANPGVFVSNTVVGELDRSLDITIGKVNFDENGEFKVTSKGLIDFLKDPAKAVQGAIDDNKATRQATRAKFLGEVVSDFINTSWAYKYGDLEVKKAMATTAVANQKRESYKIAEAMGQYARGRLSGSGYAPSFDIMAERSLDLLGKKTFGESTWDSMGADAKTEFTQIVSGGAEAQDSIGRTMFGTSWDSMSTEDRRKHTKNNQKNIGDYLARKYSNREANNFKDLTDRITKGKPDVNINIFDPDIYKTLEKDNILTRMKDIGTVPIDSKEAQEKRMYRKALLLLNSDTQSKEKLVRSMNHLKKEISKTTNKDKKKELKKQLKDSKSALRVISSEGRLAKLGQYEGYLNSLRDVWGPGGTNVAASVLGGQFFHPYLNTVLNPVFETGIGDKDRGNNIKFYLAKKEKNSAGKDRVILNKYNKMGENIYYMTPRSIFKTLIYNGEGFARAMHYRLEAFDKLTEGITDIDDIKGDFLKNIRGGDVANLDKFVADTLKKLKASKKLSPDQLLKVEKLLKGSAKYRKLTHRFSILARFQNTFNKIIAKRIDNNLRKLRTRFARVLLKNKAFRNLLVKTGANKLLGQWIASGGIRVLIKSLATAVAGAVGLVGTPLASFVVSAITWVATDVLMKMFKESLVIMKYLSLGILCLIVLLILSASGAVKKLNKNTFSYSTAIPASVVDCGMYGIEPIAGSDLSFIDPDYQTQCVGGETIQGIYERVVSMMGLRTQLELISCPGHDMCPRIDWAWCYSADKIYCRADRLAGASCLTLERLFIHELVHQIQGANAGRIYGTKLREWGADYLSSNGGGYRFMTPEGCVRATQVPFPSSCSPVLLAAIARSEGWAYESDCRRYLDNYISRFCTSED